MSWPKWCHPRQVMRVLACCTVPVVCCAVFLSCAAPPTQVVIVAPTRTSAATGDAAQAGDATRAVAAPTQAQAPTSRARPSSTATTAGAPTSDPAATGVAANATGIAATATASATPPPWATAAGPVPAATPAARQSTSTARAPASFTPTAAPLRLFVPYAAVGPGEPEPGSAASGETVLMPQVASGLVSQSPLPTPTAPPPTPTPSPTPQPTPDGVERRAAVPILMYHHIGADDPNHDSLRRSLTVSPEALRNQLDYLLAQGYAVVSLEAVLRNLALGEVLPERAVALTFDDGYRDAYTVAFPILQEYGVTATFFLVTAPIDQGSPDYLTWAQVGEMSAAGMEFGAHTYTHPDLTGQSTDYVVWQVVGSQEAIEERVGHRVRTFAYPSGAYDDHAIAVVRSAGFWVAVTTEPGCELSTRTLFTLPRVRVRSQDTVAQFARKLSTCAE